MGFRVVTAEEKVEAIRLVVEMHYSVPKACAQTGVGPTALRRWVLRWRKEHEGASLAMGRRDSPEIPSDETPCA